MPIRIVCPSCSAALSVKDEYAGRAIKCPKCGGVIPASAQQPAAPAPAAPTPSKKPAFEVVDEPPKSGTGTRPAAGTGSKTAKPAAEGGTGSKASKPVADAGSKVAKPVAKSEDDEDEDRPRKKASADREDDEDERPAKRKADAEREGDEEANGEERPAKRKKGGEGDDGDGDGEERPAKRRRRGEEEDDRKGGKKKKGGAGVILAILGVLLLGCCGTGIFGLYWIKNKANEAREGLEDFAQNFDPRVNKSSYDSLKVGTTTRAQAEQTLGPAKAPTPEEIDTIYGWDKSTAESWKKYAAKNRALIWRNGDDYILVYLNPDASPNSRVQIKEWHPKNPPGASDGSNDDVMFADLYPAKKGGTQSGPAVEVQAEDLAKAFKDDRAAADAKYKDKTVLVEGKLDDIHFLALNTNALLVGLPPPPGKVLGVSIRCVVSKDALPKLLNASRGQTIKVKGTCTGFAGDTFVDLLDATVESTGPDPSVRVSAAQLIAAHAKDAMGTDEKYKEKPMTLTDCVVEGKDGEASVLVVGRTKKAPAAKIKVTVPFEIKDQLAKLKPGDTVKMFKGEFSGSFGETLYLNRAWIVP